MDRLKITLEHIKNERCACGGLIIGDRTPISEIGVSRAPKRFKCTSCARDAYVSASDL